MSDNEPVGSADFFLIHDDKVPPEDSTVHACSLLRRLRVDAGRRDAKEKLRAAGVPPRLLHVAVDPPFRMMGTDVSEVMLGNVQWGSSLFLPRQRLLTVMIHRVRDWSAVSRRTVKLEGLHLWRPALLARTPALLPTSREDAFAEALEHMRRFAARAGHSDVPKMHVEGSYNLGIWVQSARRGGLNLEEATRLATIPEWRWLSPEELALLEAYAEREGHTDPPDTYVVNHLALENLVSQVRRQHRNGLVSPEEARRLEQIPHWHW